LIVLVASKKVLNFIFKVVFLTVICVLKALKAECNRLPTQANFDRLEVKTQVMQRLKAQLMNPRSPSICETNFEVSFNLNCCRLVIQDIAQC